MERVVLIDCDSLLYKGIEDLDEYKDRIDEIISEVVVSCEATHYKCFIEVKGNQTFRKVLANTYKSKRKPSKLPNINEIKEYIMEVYDPYISCGVESDDSIISTWSYLRQEYPFTDVFIAGNDKDYLTYPIQYIDLYHGRYLNREKLSKSEADYNFIFQMLRGDSVDCVDGLKGVGDGKAKKLLENIPHNYFSYAKLLISLYKKQYKSYLRAKKEIENNYNLLRLRSDVRHPKEFTEVVYY